METTSNQPRLSRHLLRDNHAVRQLDERKGIGDARIAQPLLPHPYTAGLLYISGACRYGRLFRSEECAYTVRG